MNKQIQKTREKAVKMLLSTVGDASEREGLLETPHRVAKMYDESQKKNRRVTKKSN